MRHFVQIIMHSNRWCIGMNVVRLRPKTFSIPYFQYICTISQNYTRMRIPINLTIFGGFESLFNRKVFTEKIFSNIFFVKE